jgi:hypothetical protein
VWSTGATTQTIVVVGDGASSYSVTVTDTNLCDSALDTFGPVQDCTGGGQLDPPSDPDNPLSVTPLKVLNTDGDLWLVDWNALATRYNVYTNPLATFDVAGDEYGSPDGPVAGTCAIVPFPVDNGDGTANLTFDLPDDSWFLITVAGESAGSESTTGADSAGTERSTVPIAGWTLCGP